MTTRLKDMSNDEISKIVANYLTDTSSIPTPAGLALQLNVNNVESLFNYITNTPNIEHHEILSQTLLQIQNILEQWLVTYPEHVPGVLPILQRYFNYK